MPTGHGDVVEEHVGVRVPAGRDELGVEQEARAGVRAAQHHEHGRPARKGVHRSTRLLVELGMGGLGLIDSEVAGGGRPRQGEGRGAVDRICRRAGQPTAAEGAELGALGEVGGDVPSALRAGGHDASFTPAGVGQISMRT
jgi:hypothetical protein